MAETKDAIHTVRLEGRETLTISGVSEVMTFDESEIKLSTVMGGLVIKGKRLEILRVDTEDGGLAVRGDILSLQYSEKRRNIPDNIVSRVFR